MSLPLLCCGTAPDAEVRRVAVTSDGRRDPLQATATAITSLTPGAAIILEHGGPATARWSSDRAAALDDDVVDPATARRARRMDDAAVAAVIAAFAASAAHVRCLGGVPIVAAVDDDLLHRALSPLGGGGRASDVVLAILRACAPCDLLLTVEDLAPGGLSPAAGVAFARRAVDVSGAARLIAAGGTGWLEPLRSRRKGRSLDRTGLGLASSAWCVGAVPVRVPVWGYVRGEVDADVVRASARRLGLGGVLQSLEGQPGRP